MIQIYNNLYIGNDLDFQSIKDDKDFYVIHACKEPYHRQLLGYKGKSCDVNHPEYLYAERDNRLYLNMVDALDKKYIRKELFIKANETINNELKKDKKVLVHCNQGQSRAPGIGLYYLYSIGYFDNLSYEEIKKYYTDNVYPNFSPNKGIDDWLRENINKKG